MAYEKEYFLKIVSNGGQISAGKIEQKGLVFRSKN